MHLEAKGIEYLEENCDHTRNPKPETRNPNPAT
jgi:hypothetical protein